MFSDTWVKSSIESICLQVTSGGTPSRKVPENFVSPADGGTPWLKTKELDDRVIYQTEEHITDDAIETSSAKLLPKGTVVMAMYGATVGKLGLLGTSMTCNQAVCAMVVDDTKASNKFLFYSLLHHRNQIVNLAVGSAQQNLSGQVIKNLRLPLPPLDEQQRLAEVLGALDDLIELNTTLIGGLLELADTVALKATTQAETTLTTFGEVCEIFGGGTPSTKNPDYWDGEIAWATPSDVTGLSSPYLYDTSRRITPDGLSACASRLLLPGTILMTSRATIGAFAVAQTPTAVNQGFIAVEPRQDIDRWFLFHEMRRRVSEFRRRAGGSTFPELARGAFRELSVDWPSEGGRRQLFEVLDPLHTAAAELQQEIHQLAATRDELLPLLMSGRVCVKDVAT